MGNMTADVNQPAVRAGSVPRIPDSNPAAVLAARALYHVLTHPCFTRATKTGPTVSESVPELLLARLLSQRVGLGRQVFGIDETEELTYERGRNTRQADIVGFALRGGVDPHAQRDDACDWVARIQIEVKINAAYNESKKNGQYVGDVQLDRYARYADEERGDELPTACWVLMPDSRAGARPEFIEAYNDMRA